VPNILEKIMQFKLVNILKKTITEMYGDLGELTFNKMWYSPEYGNSVYFSDFDDDIGSLSLSTKIRLVDNKTDDEYYFEPGMLKPTKNRKGLMINIGQFRRLYPKQAEMLMRKEDIKSSENLDVNTLKKKQSGVPETILQALKETYPNNWGKISEPDCETDYGVLDIFPAIPGERWSILNFFDTNPGVIRLLINRYTDENDSQTREGFKQWILDNKEELFGENSSFLQDLVKRNLQSFERGWKLESDAIDIIKRDYPSITDEDIVQHCLGAKIDRFDGKDLIVKGKGIQVKPLKKIEELPKGATKVYTYGMKDWYKYQLKDGLEYIVYSTEKDMIVFPNKKYWVSKDGGTVIHYEKMVPNPFV